MASGILLTNQLNADPDHVLDQVPTPRPLTDEECQEARAVVEQHCQALRDYIEKADDILLHRSDRLTDEKIAHFQSQILLCKDMLRVAENALNTTLSTSETISRTAVRLSRFVDCLLPLDKKLQRPVEQNEISCFSLISMF
jgi:hypothetical protein